MIDRLTKYAFFAIGAAFMMYACAFTLLCALGCILWIATIFTRGY